MSDIKTLLESSAAQWQERLQRGELTSVALVDLCLKQIEAQNHQGMRLHAVINTAPTDVLHEQARKLDEERAAGKLRGPMHGIPIIIKDIIATDRSLGMPTTSGAHALREAYGKRNSPLVERLLAAGMIVLAKTNLNEFCRLRDVKSGFSCLGGQTQSPYIAGGKAKDESPIGNTQASGSSSGSAAGVAAGFAPISIGTETMGSLVHPASRAALYSLKVTNVDAPKAGALCLSRVHDSLGAMTKSVADLKAMTEIILGRDLTLAGAESRKWRVGFVDREPWHFKREWCPMPDDAWEYLNVSWKETIDGLRAAGMEVTANVDIDTDGPKKDGEEIDIVGAAVDADFKETFADFVSWLDGAKVSTFSELVAYNKEHADEALPEPFREAKDCEKVDGQGDTSAEGARVTKLGHEWASQHFGEKLHDLDVLIAPGDSGMFTFAAYYGCPNASMPWKMVKFNDTQSRPEGLHVLTRPGAEDVLLAFMAAYEKIFPGRTIPQPLLDATKA